MGVLMAGVKEEKWFEDAKAKLAGTARGQEAAMYRPLGDLFVKALGYASGDVDADIRGARGRPDLTIWASGAVSSSKVAWIVLEAKDEHGICRDPTRRAALFAEKAKYITTDTAWFVMADPTTLVARPAERGDDASTDIVLDIPSLTLTEFQEKWATLHANMAGVPQLLVRFREGDETLIATEKLTGSGNTLAEELARNAFFDGLEETTRRLQEATLAALCALRGKRQALLSEVEAFELRFHGYRFHPYPVSIEGKPKGREETIAHGREAHQLNRRLASDPALARLTLSALPNFADRTGIDPKKEADKLEQVFAIETANLILARILLIRFLEDHGFFDENTPDGKQRRRYLCNGGVHAFQGMRDYFNTHYTRLLQDAYRSGAKVYAAAFNETEHDWVLDLADDALSRNVEWAMYRFARFDFTSIRGDILTGVYDRFLDPSQRKAQGEFYTPPSIARYMLDRLGLKAEDTVLDPACGSGTFLIERYQQAVGENADRGIATYEEACGVIGRIAGNDINPFSAVLTQIQLLWHLLSFGAVVHKQGVPQILVSERANSLVPANLRDQTTTRFGDIDIPGYAAVIGNPPYVRPERGSAFDHTAYSYYSQPVTVDGKVHQGISPESNLYNLFIYRALDWWLTSPPTHEGFRDGGIVEHLRPGRLAFVVPLAFCVANNSADLRRLFMPDGRWTITEIVDMELVWRDVFDADVLPMILFAEARPSRKEDIVVIRHVDEKSIKRAGSSRRKARPIFDLRAAPEVRVAYADLFTPEGRIATRMTPARAPIVQKLRELNTLNSAAKRYWTKRKGGYQARDTTPNGIGKLDWEEQRMIGEGIARRGKGDTGVSTGLDIFKGENIRTGGLVGEPVFRQLEVATVSTPSLWRFPHIMPDRMWCLPIIEQVPCSAPFDPRQVALTNTATIFGPRPDLADFPFDLLFTSRIYGWFTLLSLRSSYQNKLRSHLYPATISQLPWSETLIEAQDELEATREPFFAACRARFDAAAELKRRADELSLVKFSACFKLLARKDQKLIFSEAFDTGEPFQVIVLAPEQQDDNQTWLLPMSEEGHAVQLPSAELANYLRLGLSLIDGEEISRSKLLELPVPQDTATAEALSNLLASFNPARVEAEVEQHVDAIDRVVGARLGLTPTEINFIQEEMREDPFLSRVRPRYPYFTPAQRGRRLSLESGARYAV